MAAEGAGHSVIIYDGSKPNKSPSRVYRVFHIIYGVILEDQNRNRSTHRGLTWSHKFRELKAHQPTRKFNDKSRNAGEVEGKTVSRFPHFEPSTHPLALFSTTTILQPPPSPTGTVQIVSQRRDQTKKSFHYIDRSEVGDNFIVNGPYKKEYLLMFDIPHFSPMINGQ
ncbi:hypothetical protein QTP88_008494 [Uroleucon formosanum]